MLTPTTKLIRSPSYPSAPLSEAIGHVRKIEGLYRTSPVDREVAVKLMGYSGLSGPANHALAALAQYGLVERAGKGELRVTSLAQAILHPNSELEKRTAVRQAAFGPSLFRELHERWPGMTPPEDGVLTYLNRQGFNQSAIKPAARAYLQTLSYLEEAGASESHGVGAPGTAESVASDDGGTPERADTVYGGARVGDLIQWESGGALQFERPTRVRLISTDGQWVAVDGSTTGIPMSQVIVEQPAPPNQPQPPMFPLGFGEPPVSQATATTEERKAVIPLDEGDVTLIYPKNMTPDGFETLAAYLAILLRREGAAAKKRADAIKALAATYDDVG